MFAFELIMTSLNWSNYLLSKLQSAFLLSKAIISIHFNLTQVFMKSISTAWRIMQDSRTRTEPVQRGVLVTGRRTASDWTWSVSLFLLTTQLRSIGEVEIKLHIFLTQVTRWRWVVKVQTRSKSAGEHEDVVARKTSYWVSKSGHPDCSLYFIHVGAGAQGDPCTAITSDLLCFPIWFLIIPNSSTTTLWQLTAETSISETGKIG
jgi:hypothetical protein